MDWLSKSYRLDTEVVAELEKLAAQYGSVNKGLRVALLGLITPSQMKDLGTFIVNELESDHAEFDKRRQETRERIDRGARRTERKPLLKPKERK